MRRKKLGIWTPKTSAPDEQTTQPFTPKRMELPTYRKSHQEKIEVDESAGEEFNEEISEDQEAQEVLKTLRASRSMHPKGSKKRRSYNLSVVSQKKRRQSSEPVPLKVKWGFPNGLGKQCLSSEK